MAVLAGGTFWWVLASTLELVCRQGPGPPMRWRMALLTRHAVVFLLFCRSPEVETVRTEVSLLSVTAKKPGRSHGPTRWLRSGSCPWSAYLHSSLAFMRAMKE